MKILRIAMASNLVKNQHTYLRNKISFWKFPEILSWFFMRIIVFERVRRDHFVLRCTDVHGILKCCEMSREMTVRWQCYQDECVTIQMTDFSSLCEVFHLCALSFILVCHLLRIGKTVFRRDNKGWEKIISKMYKITGNLG
jgi:hypothetical protein